MTLPNDISVCHKIILLQAEELTILRNRMEEIESRLSKNSGNSDKPPSSDGLSKKNVKPAFSRKKGRKQGGQKGHKGKTLELVKVPNETVPLLPKACACGHEFGDNPKGQLTGEIRQVFDLPEPKLIVTQYNKIFCSCPECGLTSSGSFPQGVNSRVQYGSSVRALTVLLNIGNVLPFKKIKSFFSDIYGYALNESTIATNNFNCHNRLEETEKIIKEKLLEAPLNHADETGIRTAGKLHWLHTCCTALFTYLFVDTKKGLDAFGNKLKSVIANRNGGFVMHDCLPAYFKMTNYKHAICGAHILRELTALEEQGIVWAIWFKLYLLALLKMTQINDIEEGVLTENQQVEAKKLFTVIWQQANNIEPLPIKTGKRGRPKSTKGRNLLKRFDLHQDPLLAFAFNSQVPFTNNQAERDLRPIKSKLKIAGSFRTIEGAEKHARIFGFISTARKNDVNVFNELKNIFSSNSNFLTVLEGTK